MVVPDFRKPVRRIGRGDAAMLAVLAAIWGLVVLAIDPVGDFPLNDDWSYGLAVKYFVVDGRLRFTDWQSIPLITQVLWGALFTLPVGVPAAGNINQLGNYVESPRSPRGFPQEKSDRPS